MNWPRRRLQELLGIRHPIVLAPMAGGPSTPELVAAVSNAGGLGSIGAAYLSSDALRTAIRAIKSLTDRPFAVNLFIPEPIPDPGQTLGAMTDRLAPYHAALGLAVPTVPNTPTEPFDAQIAVVLEETVPVFSFTFGAASAALIESCHRMGAKVIGTATTVEEARILARSGVDAIAAQGSEAGGHRGTFHHDHATAMIGTMALVPQIVSAVVLPVIANGGIMDGRGIAAALALGASGAGLGTAFLTATEAGTNAAHRTAITQATECDTAVTRAFSGKPARGLRNRFMTEIDAAPESIPPYPWQNAMTRPLRTAAAQAGEPAFLSLWAGQGVGLARALPAARLMQALVDETQAVLAEIGRAQAADGM